MKSSHLIRSAVRYFGYDIVRYSDRVKKPLDVSHIEVLEDPAFRASVNEVQKLTLLDTARLANLWQLCRMSNPSGSLIEIGSFKGGSALHLSNSAPTRTIFVCDTFEGFGDLPLDQSLDRVFTKRQFDDTSFDRVIAPWTGKGRDVRWVRGYFPEARPRKKLVTRSPSRISILISTDPRPIHSFIYSQDLSIDQLSFSTTMFVGLMVL